MSALPCLLALAIVPLQSGLQRPSALNMAQGALQSMPKGYLRDFACTEVVRELSREGQFLRAAVMAQTVQDATERDSALSIVAQLQAPTNPREALALAGSIRNADLRGLALGEIALTRIRAGQIDESQNIVRGIVDEGRRFSTVCAMAAELLRSNRREDAQRILSQDEAVQNVLGRWHREAADQGLEGLGRDLFDERLVLYVLLEKAKQPISVYDIQSSIYDYAYGLSEIMQLGELAGLRSRSAIRPGSSGSGMLSCVRCRTTKRRAHRFPSSPSAWRWWTSSKARWRWRSSAKRRARGTLRTWPWSMRRRMRETCPRPKRRWR